MAKIRVYELAKELNISSKELITLLEEEFSVEVKNHMSAIEDEDADLIKELLSGKEKSEKTKEEDDEIETTAKNPIKESTNNKKANKRDDKKEKVNTENAEDMAIITMTSDTITVKEISDKLEKSYAEVIKELMLMGVMASVNQEINFEMAEKLAAKFDTEILKEDEDDKEDLEDILKDNEEEEHLQKRSPIITVMGHVDHGKTSLLDAIRKSKVTSTEAGGITQHIGAYTVELNGEAITFLDTPGHAAFTAMRARGAQVTDIVILVVAADDGIMPQTQEAISHCKAANVPLIVAINKIDRPGANIDKVKQELTEYGLVAEDWGGDTICVPVSAHTKEGIDDLLEMILLSSEILELKANPNRKAKGTVVEAKLDKGRGPVATLLIQNGTLRVGDSIVVGSTYGRIRAMFNDKGRNIKSAGPSTPVEILGLSEVPEAGDKFYQVKEEKTARGIADKRKEK